MTSQGGSFLDPLLSGALSTTTTTWFSPTRPNGQSQKSEITTEDSTTVTLDTIGRFAGSIADQKLTTIYCVVIANQISGTDAPDAAEFQLKGVWRRDGGSLIVVKAPTVVDSNENINGSAWTAVLFASGTSIQIRVTADNGKLVQWSSVTTFYEG